MQIHSLDAMVIFLDSDIPMHQIQKEWKGDF